MNMGPSASNGALHACDGDSAGARARQLQLQRARPSLNGRSSGRFRRFATGLGLAAVLSFGGAGAGAGELGLPPVAPVGALPIAVPGPSAKVSASVGSETTKAALAAQLIATTSEAVKQAVAAEAETPDRDPNEILQFGAMRVQRWIVETIVKASEVTGSDPVYMMALADKESSFIPANKASTSSAEGLFQFISSTWLQMVRTYGAKHGLADEAKAIESVKGKLQVRDEEIRDRILRLRRDPYLSALMAGEMMKRDRALIERKIGRQLDRSEYYLAHFLGADSAGKLMALVDDNSTQSASSAFPAAAKANKSLFYAKDGRKTRNLSVAEVYNKLDVMMGERIGRYEGVATRVVAEATE
jgi:hypothetical protein